MAVNTNQNQSYAETLRELRATRMQQLRQSSTQTQISSRHTSMLSSINNIMSKQLQYAIKMESSQRASSQQLVSVNRNLNNLSSTLSRSLSNFAATVARGANRGASAAGGAIADTASAAGSIATSIASGIGRVLPMAIAGYVVKAVTWDNMSEQTRDRISGSMGKLFSKAFQEIDSTELGHTITEALTPAFQQVKKLYGKAGENIDAVRDKVSSPGESGQRDNGPMSETEKQIRRAKVIAKARAQTGEDIYDTFSDLRENLPDIGPIPTKKVVAAVGTAGIAAGAAQVMVPDIFSSKKPPSKATEEALKTMKKFNFKGKEGLLASRLFNRASASGSAGLRFLKAFKEYKLGMSGAFIVLGGIIHFMDYKYLKDEIKAMSDEGIFNQDEVDYLIGRLKAEQWGQFFGSGFGGTLGAISGSFVGPAGTVGVGIAGSMVGSEVMGSAATAAYDLMNKRPESLNTDVSEESFPTTKKLFKKGYGLDNEKPNTVSEGKPQANVTPDVRDLPYGNDDVYRQIVGKHEGGALGYDAVFGAYSQTQLEDYKKEAGAKGKKVSEMTIGEAIAFGYSRGGNRGALGKYQFMPKTLEGLYAKAGLKKTDLFNAENQDKLFYKFTKLNGEFLENNGIQATPFNLRLAHAIGQGGAIKMLKAEKETPNKVPADVLGGVFLDQKSSEYKTNRQLHSEGKGNTRNVTVTSYMARLRKQLGGDGGGQSQVASAGLNDTSNTKPDQATAQIPEETPEEKRRKKLTNLFENTKAAFDPEKIKSDLLESLEIAKTVMMGNGESGGTTVINNDNSVNSSGGGGGSAPVASGGKAVRPDYALNNFEHNSMV